MITLVTAILLFGVSGYAQPFQEANTAYQNGDYPTAVSGYESLVEGGIVHPVVFFNLGNAYYRTGQLGPAIANYERALQLDPNFDSAQKNLQQAVQGTKRQLARPAPPKWERMFLFWHHNLKPGIIITMASVCWCLFWLVLALRQWHPIRYGITMTVVMAILTAAFGVSAWCKTHPAMLAVATMENVPVYYGTDPEGTVYFELFTGDRCLVDRHGNGWVRVSTGSGERGWAREEGFTFVGPPYTKPSLTRENSTPGSVMDGAVGSKGDTV